VISLWLAFSSGSEEQKSIKRGEVGQQALLAGNDIQVVAGNLIAGLLHDMILTKVFIGIALLISALIEIKTLSFYH
jgi:hypothetical protein